MIRPFLVLGLPRSRTYWLSRFLTYQDWYCGHEEARYIHSMEDARTWFKQPFMGSSETAVAPFWRLIQKFAPETRIVTIRRPVEEVKASLARIGFDERVLPFIDRANAKLDQIEARWPNAMTIPFSELASEERCADIFEFCLPYDHDAAWWRMLSGLNLQAHMPAILRYTQTFWPQLDRFSKIAKQQMLADLVSKDRTPLDGVEIRQESFGDFYRDCQELFAEHLAEVGEFPEAYAEKNLKFLNSLDEAGAMQILVARSNGRPFGYLMSEISPSRENPSDFVGTHTRFFASKAIPGLGLRLQREAQTMLRKKGISEVWGFTSARGDGPRLGSLYRRLGFQEIGATFSRRLDS